MLVGSICPSVVCWHARSVWIVVTCVPGGIPGPLTISFTATGVDIGILRTFVVPSGAPYSPHDGSFIVGLPEKSIK